MSKNKTRTKDKYRVVYNDTQRIELENEFRLNEYIAIPRKQEIAQKLQLSERQIKIWFQNRRAKKRKQQKRRQTSNNNNHISTPPYSGYLSGNSTCTKDNSPPTTSLIGIKGEQAIMSPPMGLQISYPDHQIADSQEQPHQQQQHHHSYLQIQQQQLQLQHQQQQQQHQHQQQQQQHVDEIVQAAAAAAVSANSNDNNDSTSSNNNNISNVNSNITGINNGNNYYQDAAAVAAANQECHQEYYNMIHHHHHHHQQHHQQHQHQQQQQQHQPHTRPLEPFTLPQHSHHQHHNQQASNAIVTPTAVASQCWPPNINQSTPPHVATSPAVINQFHLGNHPHQIAETGPPYAEHANTSSYTNGYQTQHYVPNQHTCNVVYCNTQHHFKA